MGPACPSCEEERRDTPAARATRAEHLSEKQERLSRLWQLGRLPQIGLVGCGKSKREGVHAARDLYVGKLFRDAFALSRQEHDETYVLSALHGLVKPDDRLESYDYSLCALRPSEQHRWGHGVVAYLKTLFPDALELRFVLFAGAGYVRPILTAAREKHLAQWSFDDPMAGMGLFQRFRWLNRHQSLTPK
jgi:hypothetical protein